MLHSRDYGRDFSSVHFNMILHLFVTAVGSDERWQQGACHRHKVETSWCIKLSLLSAVETCSSQ